MENLFIGVDGGGTKTEAVIQNESGTIIGQGHAGPGNVKTSPQVSFQSVQTAIDNALTQAGINNPNDYRLHVGLGLAGTEVPDAKAAYLQIPHPFHTMVLNSDAYVACLGVHGGHDGAIIIIGTGVIGYQIEKGKTSRAGGYGFPHSDEGGGAWMGLEVLRATFHAYDGRRKWTPVLEKVFHHFNNDISKMTSFANASAAKPGNFGEFARFVIEGFSEDDPISMRLFDEAADEIDHIWDALERQAKTELSCGLLGGVAPFLQPYLSRRLKARLVPRQMNAPEGAILMLKKHMGLLP